MADRIRKYNSYIPFDRPKLPRNKYGIAYSGSTVSTGGSLFNNSAQSGTMVDIADFVGATATEDGLRGLVPAPLAGMHEYNYLSANGLWEYIPAAKWFKEWPQSDGLEKTGLTIDGDLNVQKTLSTLNLRVEGAAHFWSLVIDEVKANGGQVLVSPSLFIVDHVGDLVTYDTLNATNENVLNLFKMRVDIYNAVRVNEIASFRARRLYMRCDDGSKRTKNEVVPGDMMRCKSFNIKEGVYRNIQNTDYWSFVLDTGEGSYIDEDGVEREAFWIDMVYSMRTRSGKVIPIGSVLHLDGTEIDIPESWTEISDILELKKVSQQVLTGEYVGDEENLDGQELIDVQNKVIQIRGLDDNINTLVGLDSSDTLTTNNIVQVARQLAFINSAEGEENVMDTFDEGNISQIILTGKMLDSDPLEVNDLNEQTATTLIDGTAEGQSVTTTNKNLVIERNKEINVVIADGTTTERDFTAADDLLDSNDNVIFHKGDNVPSGTVTEGDWKMIDTPSHDSVLDSIDDGEEEPVYDIPDNIDEINNETDNTSTGLARDTEYVYPDYETMTEWVFGYGIFSCRTGDSLACLGHLWNTDRQNAIVLSATTPIDPELTAPAIAQYNGIDRFGESISKFRLTSIAANGNEFCGSFLVNYDNKFIDVNDRINMFMTDIVTGLETVGIHLDGENSTITLVGSVDLRQHSNDNYDTLNVYDSLNTKRVEITPQKIPTRTATDSTIADTGNHIFTATTAVKNATSEYIKHTSGIYWHGFNSYWQHRYELKDYSVSFTTSATLGYMKQNTILDLRKLALNIGAKTYLNGNKYVTNHGDTGDQRIDTLTFRLKRDGVIVNTLNLKNNSSLSITGLDSDSININISGAVLDNFSIPTNGTYTVEIFATLIVYAYATTKNSQSNPYFKINSSISGNIQSYVERAPEVNDNMGNTKLTIGNNGLVFAGNNSRYFYAATDGYEMKWDDTSLKIDSTNGIRKNGSYRSITGLNRINVKDDVVVCSYASGGYLVSLPSASEYGIGRMLFISTFKGLKLAPFTNDTISVADSTGIESYSYIEFGESTLTNSYRLNKYSVMLIAAPGSWHIVNI